MEAAASTFPKDDTTPPVTKMNFVVTSRPPFLFGRALETAACPVHIPGRPVSSVYADELRCHGAAPIPTASRTRPPVVGSSRQGPVEADEAASGTRPREARAARRAPRPHHRIEAVACRAHGSRTIGCGGGPDPRPEATRPPGPGEPAREASRPSGSAAASSNRRADGPAHLPW